MRNLKYTTTLTGFVGQDAILKEFEDSDLKIVAFPFAVDDSYKDKKGAIVKRTLWFTVERFFYTDKRSYFHEIFKKGKPFTLEGKVKGKAYPYKETKPNGDTHGCEMILTLNDFTSLPYNKANNSVESISNIEASIA